MLVSSAPGRLWRFARSLATAMVTALSLAVAAHAQVLPRLPALGLQSDSVTVSGLSSGGYMAGQFQVAYSASLAGAAVLAGGPYGCAHGSVSAAMLTCSCPAEQPFLLKASQALGAGCQAFNPAVYLVFSEAAAKGNRADIDDLGHLKDHRIWLFSGGQDRVVNRQLVDAAQRFYEGQGVPAERIQLRFRSDAGHGFPSLQATASCDTTKTPFLTRCDDLDAAGELLQWLYPDMVGLSAGQADEQGSLKQFKQAPYGRQREFNGLDTTGWVYVPKACEQGGGTPCKLHVVFHGCEQGQAFGSGRKRFGLQFVTGTGYNRWAEAGHIVVLYPQVRPSQRGDFFHPFQFNPKGCWDFWGYTEKFAALNPGAPDYAKRSAPQMRAVKAMIDDLLKRP
ncbi:MAG: poly(3-hydroxybutyrate) depolymerase [Rubrivivax sp.]|nr:MAG: poly(3-hydroxybutyrate) depolymerase [Rubrivivax sp.]